MEKLSVNLPVTLSSSIVGALSLTTALESSGIIDLSNTNELNPIIGDCQPVVALILVYLMNRIYWLNSSD